MLLDTGAGKTDVAQVVDDELARWARSKGRARLPLIVAHTHSHGDHVSGDGDFKKLRDTTVVEPTVDAVRTFFGVRTWPTDAATYDLGNRIVDVIPIPGHDAASIAVYDRQTAILFTGDTLYPGRLYVQDPEAFRASIQRLVDFTRDKPVAHVLGNHIEQTRTPYVDYPVRTVYQPDEHVLELGRAHLLELNDALRAPGGGTTRVALREFTIWPQLR